MHILLTYIILGPNEHGKDDTIVLSAKDEDQKFKFVEGMKQALYGVLINVPDLLPSFRVKRTVQVRFGNPTEEIVLVNDGNHISSALLSR